jgi:endoglucanase
VDASTLRRRLGGVLACLACAAVPAAAQADAPSPRDLDPGTRLFIPAPDPAGVAQVQRLFQNGRLRDAALVGREITTPQAVWFTKGTPKEVRAEVRATMREARRDKAVPTLVAYDLPYRDCGQYSSGGAADAGAYADWIDGFARGIGNRRAIVILEPDGLGLIPQTVTDGVPVCNAPQGGGTTEAANTRFAELRGAVERLERQSRTRV